ncbi:hypothetical protein ES707_21971 [subsurface metagenome]
MTMANFNAQFNREKEYWIKSLDFPTWYRYYFLIKEVLDNKFTNILEIDPGSGIIENILKEKIENYVTMDINPNLNPTVVGDLRKFALSLQSKFECVICADVLEHMPFKDLELNLKNIFKYLVEDAEALITIPHHRKEIMIIYRFPGYKTLFFSLPTWATPSGFYQWFIKKRCGIDPYHCWEIGDKKVKRQEVEKVMKRVGFKISKFMELPYVDFWVLKK